MPEVPNAVGTIAGYSPSSTFSTADPSPRTSLIAPCPRQEYEAGVWKIADRPDARIPGHKDLATLAGQRVIRPNDPEFYPNPKSLEWREARRNTSN